MLKKHSQVFEGLFTATDLLVVSLAWALSYWIRFSWGMIPVEKGIPPFSDYIRMLIFVWLIWAFVFRRFQLYRPMRGISRWREIWLLIRANTFSVLLLLSVVYLFREKSVPFSRLVFFIFWGMSTTFTILSRTLIRIVLRSMRRRGFNLRYALIVGSGALAQKVASRMLTHPEYGVELLGCLTRDLPERPTSSVTAMNAAALAVTSSDFVPSGPNERRMVVGGAYATSASLAPVAQPVFREDQGEGVSELRIIGTYADLPEMLATGRIDQVIVAMPLADHDLLEPVISTVGDAIVDVKIVPDVHRFIQLGSLVEEFDGLPVVSLASTPLDGINRVAKRVVDLILGTFFIVLVSPLMALLAALVKLTSRGPVFFTQERMGLDGRTFNIYKFRTMFRDAEAAGARFAVRGDPRVTPLGRFMRKTSLDELPQLWNVLRGEMSLVGPRPERPVFISEFRRHIPRYMLRHKVQAGMTGWAQVNGWRGNTSIERRIEHDLYYIENWSILLDLKILGLTLVRGLRDRNAY